jgi:ribosomal protein S12 methylthiotransferase
MKIGMVSLGCPKNLVDGEVMLGARRAGGTRDHDRCGEADVLVVNTCAFIDRAKQESVDAILEMAQLKQTGACRRLVVTGCLAERYRDELRAQIPEIDAVLGTGEVPRIVEALDGPRQPPGGPPPVAPLPSTARARPGRHHQPLGARAELPTYIYDAETPRHLATPRHYAYVKIAEGCDYNCAFCIIPRLRGRYRSRRSTRSCARRGHLAATRASAS